MCLVKKSWNAKTAKNFLKKFFHFVKNAVKPIEVAKMWQIGNTMMNVFLRLFL